MRGMVSGIGYFSKKEQNMKRHWVITVVILASLTNLVSALTLYNPNYQAETFTTYTYSQYLGTITSMATDSSGNIYAYHNGSWDDAVYDGRLMKITPQKNASVIAQGACSPGDVVWGGGTAYGDYLYLVDLGRPQISDWGRIKRVKPDGSHYEEFCNSLDYGSYSPYALGIDRRGTYGGQMYCGYLSLDHIDAIGTTGYASRFSEFPFNMTDGPQGIAFDPGNAYGGLMYVGNGGNNDLSGIFSLSTNGQTYTRLAPEITAVSELKFDSSGLFGGLMFINGFANPQNPNGLYSVTSTGEISLIARGNNFWSFTFGADGAIYAAEYDHGLNITTISRIIPVPEPLTMSLLALGGLALRRRK